MALLTAIARSKALVDTIVKALGTDIRLPRRGKY